MGGLDRGDLSDAQQIGFGGIFDGIKKEDEDVGRWDEESDEEV